MKTLLVIALILPAILADMFSHSKSQADSQYQLIPFGVNGLTRGVTVFDTRTGRGIWGIPMPDPRDGQQAFHIDTSTLTVIWDRVSSPLPATQNP
jgi:hypothetical protein